MGLIEFAAALFFAVVLWPGAIERGMVWSAGWFVDDATGARAEVLRVNLPDGPSCDVYWVRPTKRFRQKMAVELSPGEAAGVVTVETPGYWMGREPGGEYERRG